MFRRNAILSLCGVVAGSSLSIRHLLGSPASSFGTSRTSVAAFESEHSDGAVNQVSELQRLQQQLQQCQRNCQVLANRMQLQGAAAEVLLLNETSRLCELAELRLGTQSGSGMQSPAFWQACSDACLRAAELSRSEAMRSASAMQVFTRTADCCRQMIS